MLPVRVLPKALVNVFTNKKSRKMLTAANAGFAMVAASFNGVEPVATPSASNAILDASVPAPHVSRPLQVLKNSRSTRILTISLFLL